MSRGMGLLTTPGGPQMLWMPLPSQASHADGASPRPTAWPQTLVMIGMLGLALAASPALAGRPLSSDDAATADPGSCQIEGWGEKSGGSRAWVLAPACGVAEGWEIDLDYTHPQPQDELRGEAGFAIKWVPKSWSWLTPAGTVNFGLKFGVGYERPVDGGWRRSGQGLLGLATLVVNEDFALHANLGPHQDRASKQVSTGLNLALVWVPHPAGPAVRRSADERPAGHDGPNPAHRGRLVVGDTREIWPELDGQSPGRPQRHAVDARFWLVWAGGMDKHALRSSAALEFS